jgi:hypothetical protein
MKKTATDLLSTLATTRVLAEASDCITELVRYFGFKWRAVGDREGNFGLINIGSDPGYAIVERVTNAIDAVVEMEAVKRLTKPGKRAPAPTSPREAVEEWFGVPGGRVANLPAVFRKDLPKKGIPTRQDLADFIAVRILDSTVKKNPTIEIRDHGIGLTPATMPNTILSLNDTNKIDKLYLAGAFGQGGSTALAFSPLGTLFVSRRQPDLLSKGAEDLVGVTFARFNELDANRNKNGRYEYLVDASENVASIGPAAADNFEPGTSVVHFNLEIPQYSQRMTQVTGSLWWLLQNALFDPVLPFWVEERRTSMLDDKKISDRRTIAGNYTRLMDEKNDRVEYSNSADVALLHSSGQTTVKVNYWVIKPNPDNPGGQPTEAYVDAYKPITFTLNGQTHDRDDRRFIMDRLSLPYLAKSLIIQVELDHLSPQARRSLLSSTRDRLKQLGLFEDMREGICAALSEDEELWRLNEMRKEQLLARHSETEKQKMRERFARLMERFKAGADLFAKAKGTGTNGRKTTSTRTRREPLAPLPTKDEPTYISIANIQKPVPIQLQRHALLRLESDAPDGYLASHVHAKLTLACEPEGLVALESRSDFRGGRSRVTVKASDGSRPGDAGTLTVYLFTPRDKQLTAKIKFVIEEPLQEPTSGNTGRAKAAVPDPIPVTKKEWKEHDWDESSVAKVMQEERDTQIYVNIDNRHLVKLLNSASYQETGIKRMRTNFLLYVAFYAWVREVTEKGKDAPIDAKALAEYEARELDRLAQTVVYSISAASRMDDDEE